MEIGMDDLEHERMLASAGGRSHSSDHLDRGGSAGRQAVRMRHSRSGSVTANDADELAPLSSYSFQAEFRQKLWMIMEHPHCSVTGVTIAVLVVVTIVLSVALYIVQTLPEYHGGGRFWTACEWIAMLIFTAEYGARLYSAPHIPSFLKGPLNIIDFFAFFPFYVALIASESHSATGFAILRMARIVRLVRVFKLSRYSRGLRVFAGTLRKSSSALVLLGIFMIMNIIVFSTLVYFAERGDWDSSEGHWVIPDEAGNGTVRSPFQSIPHSFWFVMATITTTGYGDDYPITPEGKFVASTAMIVGILIIALPVTIIGVNFAHAYQEEMGAQQGHAFVSARGRSSSGSFSTLMRSQRDREHDIELEERLFKSDDQDRRVAGVGTGAGGTSGHGGGAGDAGGYSEALKKMEQLHADMSRQISKWTAAVELLGQELKTFREQEKAT